MAAPAAAAASGSETFTGTIVTSGVSGTRTVLTSAVVTKGMVSGAGRIVEVPHLPADLDTFSRDHLIFASDSIHIVSTNMDFSVSVNPSSCLPTVTIQPTGEFAGDIGQFAAATGRFGRLHGVRPAPGPAVVAELSRPPCRAHDVGETFRLVAGRNEHATQTQPTAAQDATSGWWPSKYGADDQAGALNEITPGKTLEAVRLVRRGRVASLSASTWPSPFLTRMHGPQLAQGVQVAIECDPNPAFDGARRRGRRPASRSWCSDG
jgi:hypothetical protein